MDTPLITWTCIVGLIAVVGVVRLIAVMRAVDRNGHRLIEFGSERESMFIPGDPDPRKIDESDYEDFDDL